MELSLSPNKKFLIIDSCTEIEYEQLKISLTKKIKGWRFHPLVKKKLWNGEITFLKRNKIPSGLWKEIVDICKEYDYQLKLNNVTQLFNSDIKETEFKEWVFEYFQNNPMKPRDYQIDAAIKILKYRRCLAELATSAGKTLISYMVISYMFQKLNKKKILFIVPNVSLVVQGTGDFQEYNKGKVQLRIQQIYSGVKIKPSSNIVIGTYQSLSKKDSDYFQQFDVVMVDECLHPDTNITMADNTIKKISDVKRGEIVKTINDKTGEIENNKVDYVHKNLSKNQQMYELETEDGEIIKITGNHKVKLINGIYKRVDELTLDDEILSIYDVS